MNLKRLLKRNRLVRTTGRDVLWALTKAATYTKRVRWSLERPGKITRYLRSANVAKLQMGAGFNLFEDWLNTDYEPRSRRCVYLDTTKAFPLPDHSFDYVFTEHMIEHLTYDDGQRMLRECYRVLKPHGKIRIATPSLAKLLNLYDSDTTPEVDRYTDWALDFNRLPRRPAARCFIVNNFLRAWGHQFVYDPQTLKAALEEVGFTDVYVCEPGQSADAALRGLEMHGSVIGEENNRFETMALEATR